jgi:hypothetical protein
VIDFTSLSLMQKLALGRKRRVRRTLGDGYTVRLTLEGNRKTGPIPTSMTDMASCPTSCGLRDLVCYAEHGHTALQWRRVPNLGMSWPAFCEQIAALPEGTLWRHNVAGDLPGVGDELDIDALADLVEANRGRRAFTFTHKPLRHAHEREAVRGANDAGFTINLSADTVEEADGLVELGIGPVALFLADGAPTHRFTTPAGHTVIVCLNETDKTKRPLTCADCKLCSKQRKSIVAFPKHGPAQGFAPLVALRKKGVPA